MVKKVPKLKIEKNCGKSAKINNKKRILPPKR